jgi:GTP-binding protein
MKPTLAIVGRPNVGKSTLFNRLTRTRDALVADVPGLTRDRHYGAGRLGGRAYLVVDTGGLEPEAQGVFVEMAKQARTAIAEADVVVLVTDAREGLTAQDRSIAEELRRGGRRVLVAVNKAEGMNLEMAEAEFHELGLGAPHAIPAEHGEGVSDLVGGARGLSRREERYQDDGAFVPRRPSECRAFTLVNTLVGEERVVTFDHGTARDDRRRARVEGLALRSVDTAGLKRRGSPRAWKNV